MAIKSNIIEIEFEIDRANGLVSNAVFIPSPNFNERPVCCLLDLIVIHNISLPAGEFGKPYITQLFTNTLDFSEHPEFSKIAGLQVSAHCLIQRDGSLIQYVSFNDRAWHAGKSSYKGREDCNDYSIGIELEGTDEIPYTPEQYQVLVGLLKALQKAYIELSYCMIVGHSTIAPSRKSDPGPSFDWDKLASLLKEHKVPLEVSESIG